MDEFSFPDLDSVLQESKKSTTFGTSSKEAKGKRQKVKAEPEYKPPENVDEITLNKNELDRLQKTLSGYPLNLRIACEEIIAEQVVEPDKLSKLIRHLVNGSLAKETALLAGHILGKIISIPKGFEKSSGEALEAEQRSFAYIFVHNFLPILRILALIAVLAGSLFFLIYTFIYLPGKAESIYKQGYERIFAGEYQQANVRFSEAFDIHRKKDWFYKYAEAFRDERQYIYAEQKYDDLLRYYLRDKKGILDYAYLETNYLRNYAKADNLLRRQLLDYAPNDYEGLLAVGDNSLVWGEIDPSKYEDARYAYARVIDKYGQKEPVMERMMLYFIRTDDLKEVIYLRQWFDAEKKRKITANTLAELGGYYLDKQLEEVRGVPNEYLEYIDRVRDLLLEAVEGNPALPEAHYHLARYFNRYEATEDERISLEHAIQAFDNAPEESVRRLNYRIDTHQRYADLLINAREFIPAEEQLVRGIGLYEDAISRRLMSRSPQYGRLYSGLGDLEYFTKTGDMEAALRFYRRSEQNGYAPPEMQYRMGSAYYQLEDWRNSLEYLFAASSSLPLNHRILFALGNTALKRGDNFAAYGYYNRLIDILESQRIRLPSLLPSDRPEYLELAERLMMARNNAGVACEALADQTGNRSYQTRALAFYAEAERAWDSRTRNPTTMIRSGSTPLPYLNMRNALYPRAEYEPQIFIRIDREASENSPWEKLAPLAWLDRNRSN
jgi:TolA-binding protein